MRRTVILLAAAIVLTLAAAPAAFAQDDQNCADFDSQAAAQAHLRQDPSDPDGLDADNDGVACENYQGYPEGSPRDETPVETATDGGGTTPEADGGDALPFTGPSDGQLPLGAGLVAIGVAVVFLARYRPRHGRR